MKFFLTILTFAACSGFGRALEIQLDDSTTRPVCDSFKLDSSSIPTEGLQAIIADKISGMFIRKLVTKHAAPRDSVLPDLPDPLEIENAELDLGELGINGISGFVALRDGSATGLSTVDDDLNVDLTIPARITFDLKAPALAATGDYEATDVLIDEIPASGAGELDAKINDLHLLVVVRVIVLLNGRLTFQSVAIDVDFASVELNLKDLVVCGEPVDWDAVNEDAKPVFDEFWADNKEEVETLVKDILQEILKDCSVFDLIAGDFSCLPIEIPDPGSGDTTTTTTTSTTTEPPSSTLETTTASASHAQTGAGILFGTLLMVGARLV